MTLAELISRVQQLAQNAGVAYNANELEKSRDALREIGDIIEATRGKMKESGKEVKQKTDELAEQTNPTKQNLKIATRCFNVNREEEGKKLAMGGWRPLPKDLPGYRVGDMWTDAEKQQMSKVMTNG